MITNKNFGKQKDGRIEYAPSVICFNGQIVTTNVAETLLLAGYKRVIDTPAPSKDGSYRKTYTEDDETITISWEEVQDAD